MEIPSKAPALLLLTLANCNLALQCCNLTCIKRELLSPFSPSRLLHASSYSSEPTTCRFPAFSQGALHPPKTTSKRPIQTDCRLKLFPPDCMILQGRGQKCKPLPLQRAVPMQISCTQLERKPSGSHLLQVMNSFAIAACLQLTSSMHSRSWGWGGG